MTSLLGCPVCWGQAQGSPMVDGAIAGVAFLLVVIVAVLVIIAMTALKWSRRAQALGEVENARSAVSLAKGARELNGVQRPGDLPALDGAPV